MRAHHYEPTAKVQALLGTLEPGYGATLATHGQVGLGDFVRATVDQLQPCKVLVSSGFVSVVDARSLGALLDCGAIVDLMLLTDRGLEAKHPNSAAAIEAAFGLERGRVCRLKARFSVVRGAFSVAIVGSGSLAPSKGVDVWRVDACEEAAAFLEDLVVSITEGLPSGWASTPEVDAALRSRRGHVRDFGVDYDLGF